MGSGWTFRITSFSEFSIYQISGRIEWGMQGISQVLGAFYVLVNAALTRLRKIEFVQQFCVTRLSVSGNHQLQGNTRLLSGYIAMLSTTFSFMAMKRGLKNIIMYRSLLLPWHLKGKKKKDKWQQQHDSQFGWFSLIPGLITEEFVILVKV